jgi:DNA topoisomerase-6 subunit B
LLQFLENEFSRVGRKTARKIIREAGKRQTLTERSYPKRIAHVQANALYQAIKRVPVSAPLTDCIVPIGEAHLEEGLRKEIDAAFYFVTTRPPQTYRGNPFQVEAGIAYGHGGTTGIELDESGHLHKTKRPTSENTSAPAVRSDEPARLIRFANRVPLLYDQGGCAITKAATQMNWRSYGLHQTKGSLPIAPLVIVVHIASVWVPFTSEAKESIAGYPEILKEVTLGLQKCGRAVAAYLRREKQLHQEYVKRTRIEKYLPHVGLALQEILDLDDETRAQTEEQLDDILHEARRIR